MKIVNKPSVRTRPLFLTILFLIILISISCKKSTEKQEEVKPSVESTLGGENNSESESSVQDPLVELAAVPFNLSTILEAEKGFLDGVKIGITRNNASNNFYVTGFDNDSDAVYFKVTSNEKKRVAVLISGAVNTGSGSKINHLYIDEVKAGEFVTPDTGNWEISAPIPVTLQKGETIISIRKSWGWFDFDYISFEEPEDMTQYYNVTREDH